MLHEFMAAPAHSIVQTVLTLSIHKVDVKGRHLFAEILKQRQVPAAAQLVSQYEALLLLEGLNEFLALVRALDLVLGQYLLEVGRITNLDECLDLVQEGLVIHGSN